MWTFVASDVVDRLAPGTVVYDHVRLADGEVHIRFDGKFTPCGQRFTTPARLAPTTPLTCVECAHVESTYVS